MYKGEGPASPKWSLIFLVQYSSSCSSSSQSGTGPVRTLKYVYGINESCRRLAVWRSGNFNCLHRDKATALETQQTLKAAGRAWSAMAKAPGYELMSSISARWTRAGITSAQIVV
ncbi:unnamed protein product [Fusarium graminearum]|nr:unnamed protein product [Fusarium graminearum]